MVTNVSIRQFPSPEHPYIAFPSKNLAVLDISSFTTGEIRTKSRLMTYYHILSYLFKVYCIHGRVQLRRTLKWEEVRGTILSKTVNEKDLGVTINANMKVSEQCRIAASKDNQALGMIRRNILILYRKNRLIVPLYKAIVRHHLAYVLYTCMESIFQERQRYGLSGVPRGVFWLPGMSPPPAMIYGMNYEMGGTIISKTVTGKRP